MKVRMTKAMGYSDGAVMAFLNGQKPPIPFKREGVSDSYLVDLSAEQIAAMREKYPPCPHGIVVLEQDAVPVKKTTDAERLEWLQSLMNKQGDLRELIDLGMQDADLREEIQCNPIRGFQAICRATKDIDEREKKALALAGGAR